MKKEHLKINYIHKNTPKIYYDFFCIMLEKNEKNKEKVLTDFF